MTTQKKHWHERWWGIVFLLSVGIGIVLGLLIGYQTLYYVQHLEQGDLTVFNQNLLPPDILKQGTTPVELEKEISEIRRSVESTDDPYVGGENAEVVIVEFIDFQCQFCKEAAPIMKQVIQRYGDKIKVIWRDMPIEYLHPLASQAAQASECADDQGKYLEFHDYIFDHQSELQESTDLLVFAKEIGLGESAFVNCMANNKYEEEVQADLAVGAAMGITGTPTYFVNGVKISGVVPLSSWVKLLDAHLN